MNAFACGEHCCISSLLTPLPNPLHLGVFDLEHTNTIFKQNGTLFHAHKIIEIIWNFTYHTYLSPTTTFSCYSLQQFFRACFDGNQEDIQSIVNIHQILHIEERTISWSTFMGLGALCSAWNGHMDNMVTCLSPGITYVWCCFAAIEQGYLTMFDWLMEYYEEYVRGEAATEIIQTSLFPYVLFHTNQEESIVHLLETYENVCVRHVLFPEPKYRNLGLLMSQHRYKIARCFPLIFQFFESHIQQEQEWNKTVCYAIFQSCFLSLPEITEYCCEHFHAELNDTNSLSDAIRTCKYNEDIECTLILLQYIQQSHLRRLLFIALKEQIGTFHVNKTRQFQGLLYQRKYWKLMKRERKYCHTVIQTMIDQHARQQLDTYKCLNEETTIPSVLCEFIV